MSKPWKHAPQTVRRPSVGVPILWCLLASALTGVVVYRWGRERWTPVAAGPAYTATAYVVEGPAECVKRTARPYAEGPGVTGVTRRPSEVMGPSPLIALTLALSQRERGPARVPFTCSDDDAERAAQAANGLAES